jgi:hypothetical protein
MIKAPQSKGWFEMIPGFSLAPGARLTTHGAGGVYGYDAAARLAHCCAAAMKTLSPRTI